MKWLQSSKISLAFTGVLSFAVVVTATEDTWTYKADMPTARTWMGGCVLDGKIYVIGGARSTSSVTSAVEMYDPLADRWTKLADIPSARCYQAACTFNGKIYVFSGSTGVWSSADKSVFVYDPQIDAWTRKADMPYAIAASGIAVVENTIYLIGGTLNTSSPPVGTVMAFNPMTESWTQKADMPTARELISACVVDGKIYAIGGSKENWQSLAYKHVEIYDPSTNTWTRKADMPTERFSPAACVADGKIYVIGGCSNGLQAGPVNEVYDPATDTWTTKSPMQQRRLGHFAGLVGGKIYAIGGHYPSLIVVSKTEEYDTGLTIVPSPDFNGDGIVDIQDLLRLVESWGQNDPVVDIAPPPFGDGVVDKQDLELLMSYWGQEIANPALIAHWKLDEAEGSIAEDTAGANDGVLHGEPLWQPSSGKKAGAMQLDGIDDYVSTGFVLNPADGPFSVLVWTKTGAPGQAIISQADGEAGRHIVPGSMWLGTDASAGGLVTTLMGTFSEPLSSQYSVIDGSWHHVGLVWDGLQRHLFVDGVHVAEDATVIARASSTGSLYMGAGRSLESGSFFSGLFDDVRIYNLALSPTELEQIAR